MGLLVKNNIKEISQKYDIPESTLYKWVNEKSIQSHLKFILFILEFVQPSDLKAYCTDKLESQKKEKEP